MLSACQNPAELSGITWWLCYLTTNTHFEFYKSFVVVLCLIMLTAPLAMMLGICRRTCPPFRHLSA